MEWVCIVFLPNQTEENSSCIETRSLPCPPYHLTHTLAPDRHKAEKHPLIKAVTCCFLAPSPGSGRGMGRATQPLLGAWPLPARPAQITQPEISPFFLLSPMAFASWAEGMCRLCTCHLELPVGRDHTWLLCASPHLEQPLHRKGSNTCVWRSKLSDWGVCEFVHSFFSSFLLLGGRQSWYHSRCTKAAIS